MITVGKLTKEQTAARLKTFPDLLELRNQTEGALQLVSSASAYTVSHSGLRRETLNGVVYDHIGTEYGVDAGTLSIGNVTSKIINHPNSAYGVFYGGSAPIDGNAIFGKTIAYKMQKGGDAPVFQGEMNVPTKISLSVPDPNHYSKLSRTTGKITWNSDPNNEIGVGVAIAYMNDQTRKSRGETFLVDDTGSLNVTDFIKSTDTDFTYIYLTLYRGNGVVKTGTDGKKYKVVVFSSCDNNYYFEP